MLDAGPQADPCSDLYRERTLFYLDAHWNDYLPLRDEVQLILENDRQAVTLYALEK